MFWTYQEREKRLTRCLSLKPPVANLVAIAKAAMTKMKANKPIIAL